MSHDHWSPALAWLVLTIFVILFVVVFDLHAYLTHGRSMTGQFQDWLFNVAIGPFIFGGWIGLFAGLTFHWFGKKVQ
jgi:hypothetical protein